MTLSNWKELAGWFARLCVPSVVHHEPTYPHTLSRIIDSCHSLSSLTMEEREENEPDHDLCTIYIIVKAKSTSIDASSFLIVGLRGPVEALSLIGGIDCSMREHNSSLTHRNKKD